MPVTRTVIAVPALVLAALLPTIGAAIAISALEGYRLVRPESRLFQETPAASFADALVHGSVEQAYEFLRSGADLNEPLSVEAGSGRVLTLSPLAVATLGGNTNTVLMLIGRGARFEGPDDFVAICRAPEHGDADLQRVLQAESLNNTSGECPTRQLPDSAVN